MSAPAPENRLWTPANVVTVVRICGVPFFVAVMLGPWPEWVSFWPDAWLWKPWLAALLFIVLAATDGLDGYLARSRKEVTNFGKFVDPLADKMLTTSALLALVELGDLPSWPVIVILCREFIVSGIRMLAASTGVVIAASWYGKAKTVTQIVAIVLFITKNSPLIVDAAGAWYPLLYAVAWLAMMVAVVLTIISMLDYFVKAKELLGFTASKRRERRSWRRKGSSSQDAAEEKPAEEDWRLGLEDAELRALAAEVLDRARAEGRTLATAESLTGGMISAALTAVPGSSDVVRGGVVSYATDVKERALGVERTQLERTGPVDENVAVQMAHGARQTTGAGLAVAVTGIAGPGGAEPGKPVGTVCFGLVDDNIEYATRREFPGDRNEVRRQTVRFALQLCLRALNATEQG